MPGLSQWPVPGLASALPAPAAAPAPPAAAPAARQHAAPVAAMSTVYALQAVCRKADSLSGGRLETAWKPQPRRPRGGLETASHSVQQFLLLSHLCRRLITLRVNQLELRSHLDVFYWLSTWASGTGTHEGESYGILWAQVALEAGADVAARWRSQQTIAACCIRDASCSA